MDERTVSFYNAHAGELSGRYESANMSHLYHLFVMHLPEGASVFEIGGGTGRDAAFLMSRGHEVTSVDASAALVDAAVSIHPELRDHVHCAPFPLPDGSGFLERKYEAVVSVAVVMHVPDQDLFGFAYQVRQLLKEGGVAILSVSTGRSAVEGDRDAGGRLFRERPPDEIALLFERLGFRLVATYRTPDTFGRGVIWHTLVLQVEGGIGSRSVDHVETIIRRDRKDATYKLALLRALCDIARTEHFKARWRPDGSVEVPLGLLAEKWLTYYWPIVELDLHSERVVIPQKRGREIHVPIAFRASLLELVRAHGPGALASFYRDFRSGTLRSGVSRLADATMNVIARTIVVGPVRFAGRSLDLDGPFFVFEGRRTAWGRCDTPEGAERSLGRVVLQGALWREFCLIGHWISESIVLRWAELTAEISQGEVSLARAIERLMVLPTAEHDVEPARGIYLGLPRLRCVWTDRAIRPGEMAVDHIIPFSLWANNDLWNLLPTSRATNARKSDKLVSREVLLRQRDAIIEYWEVLRSARQQRFALEVGRTLTRHEPTSAGNWQSAAFGGLVESVEALALQRGVERWEP